MTDTTRTAPREPSSADSTPNLHNATRGWPLAELHDRIAAILAEHDGTPSDPWDQREAASHRALTMLRIMAEIEGRIVPPHDNVGDAPKWQHELASSILAVLPIGLGGDYIADLTKRIVAIVVERVGAADEILHELSDKLDEQRKSNDDIRAAHLTALQHASDLRRELEALRIAHAQLGRDFDELGTQRTLATIELERCRDELQMTRIELDDTRATCRRLANTTHKEGEEN